MMASVPGMESVVRVLTMNRYHLEEEMIEANIVTAQLEGLKDRKVQDMINEQLRTDAQAAFDGALDAKNDMEKKGKEGSKAPMGWECNYQVKTDTEELLALDVWLYQSMGSSSVIHRYYNVDKKHSSLLTLPDLMKDHPNYVRELSEYIQKEMKKANAAGEGMYFIDSEDIFGEEAFTQIAEDQLFYLNEQGQLVICFEKYQVAPGSEGAPEFVIPSEYFQWKN